MNPCGIYYCMQFCVQTIKYKIFYLAFIEYKAVVSLFNLYLSSLLLPQTRGRTEHTQHTHARTPHTGRYQDSSQLIVVRAPLGHVTHCSL